MNGYSERVAKRALIVSADKKVHEYVEELLSSEDFLPVAKAFTVKEARTLAKNLEFDVIVINSPLSDELGTEFALDYADGSAGILLICKSDVYESVCSHVEDRGIMVLPRPLSRTVLHSAIKLLISVNARLSRLEKQSRTLRGKMEDIRVVNRAKWLLIENLNMTEKDAHYYIERQAMDMRLSRREVAEQIIRTYDK